MRTTTAASGQVNYLIRELLSKMKMKSLKVIKTSRSLRSLIQTKSFGQMLLGLSLKSMEEEQLFGL